MKGKFKEGNKQVKQPEQHESKKHISNCETESSLIKATNKGLKIEEGFELAIVDVNNHVVNSGVAVQKVIFNAITSQVVQSFCSRFKSFTEDDFKKSLK